MTNFQLSKLLKGCNEIDVTISGLDKHIKDVSRRLKAQHKYLAKSNNPDSTWIYKNNIEKMTQCLAVLKSIE